ncbi:MAG: quinone oxidoreductase [Pseudomonadota bacterium]
MSEPYAIRIHAHGGPEALQVEPMDRPEPKPGDVRIRQSAVGLNFIDTYHRTGLYPVKLPFTPGSEGAGTVEALGEGVDKVSVGDRVAYVGGGAYASHVCVPADRLLVLPDGVGEDSAAALMLKGLTAWMLLFEVRRAAPGETALVWAAAGGVGSVLVPWATSLGVRVIGVVSTEEKAERVRAAGASDVIVGDTDVAGKVRRLTDGRGADVSYDSVGKSSATASLESLKPRGWWISYGNASGPADPIAPGTLGAKGSLVLTRPGLFNFIAAPEDLSRGAAALFGAMRAGTIRADIGQRFALKDVAEAHRTLEARQTTGATVLTP